MQKRDADIVAIVASSAHVAVYDYDGSWKRKEVEGPLHIVERCVDAGLCYRCWPLCPTVVVIGTALQQMPAETECVLACW